MTDQQDREGIYSKDDGPRGISAVEETMSVQSRYSKRGAGGHVGRRHDSELIASILGHAAATHSQCYYRIKIDESLSTPSLMSFKKSNSPAVLLYVHVASNVTIWYY